MSIAEIKEEIYQLPQEEQDELAAYLTVVRMNRNPEFRNELRTHKDDPSPESWLSLDELKSKLDS